MLDRAVFEHKVVSVSLFENSSVQANEGDLAYQSQFLGGPISEKTLIKSTNSFSKQFALVPALFEKPLTSTLPRESIRFLDTAA